MKMALKALLAKVLKQISNVVRFDTSWAQNVNLNNYTTTGIYFIASGTNVPYANPWAPMLVVAREDTYRQILFGYSDTIYYRVYQSNSWHSWKKITTTNV